METRGRELVWAVFIDRATISRWSNSNDIVWWNSTNRNEGFRNRTYLVDYSFVKSTSFNRIVRYPNNWPSLSSLSNPLLPAFIIHFTNGVRARRSSFYREFNFYPIRWSDLWLWTRQDLRVDTQSASVVIDL